MTLNIKGTEIRLNFSFVFVITLMLIFSQQIIVMQCILSSLLHEAGHLLFMVIFGEKILSVNFGAFGVRIERVSKANLSYKKDALIALGGIIINFLLAFLGVMYYYFMKSENALRFSLINVFVAAFNCVPVNVLDMGRALRSMLMTKYDETKADRLLGIASFVSVNIIMTFCFGYCLLVGVNLSLIFVSLYLYVITLFKKWS